MSDGTDPVEGAMVTLTNNTTHEEFSGSGTGSAGGCTIQNVPYGEYSYLATATGYNNGTGSFTVNEESGALSIVLNSQA